MTSILDTIDGIVLNPDLISTLQSDMTGIVGRAGGLPTDSIQNILSLAGQVALPDQQGIFGDSVTRLTALVESGLRSPDDLWSAVTDPLTNLKQNLTAGIQAPITQTFSSIRNIGNITPEDPAVLLGALSGPLQQVAGLLGESPELQRIQEFITKIQEIGTQLSGAPAQLATLLRDQIQAALEEATGLVSPVFRQLENFIGYLETQTQINTLLQDYEAMLFKLVPPGGSSVADAIATLDFSSVETFAEVDSQLRIALAMAQNFVADTEARMAQAAELVPTFNSEAWIQRLISAANIASSGEINDFASLLSQWQDMLSQARNTIAGLSLDNVLQPLRDLVNQMQPMLENFNLNDVRDQLVQGIQASTTVVEAVSQTQIDMLARFQNLANSIQQTIDAINLDAVTPAIENALSTIDPVLTEIEGLIDTVSTEVQGVLDSLQAELSTLHTKLTDPAGEYRAPIETFLNSIRDAIPDNIPETLGNIGQQLADAVSGLENVALDPVFDTVVDQLEKMRAELQEIDAESLSSLLQVALATALAVFRAFDFQSEVEGFLTEKFDTAIAVVDEEAIQILQEQVDGILDYVRSYNPSMLFDTLGITQAYDDMVAEINNFQPSDGLTDIVATMNNAMDQLEAMTPSQILQPLTEPLDQLKGFVQGLSLEPVLAQLQQALSGLKDLASQLDILPFIQDLTNTINQMRQQLQSILTIEGLLDFLQPIHQAVMDASSTVDPSVLLQPLTDVRQTFLNAIDAVDVTELTGAFSSISDRINGFSLPQLRVDLQGKAQALVDSMGTLDLPAKFNELQIAQQSIKDTLEARGEQADPEAEDRRQALLSSVNALEPLPLMAAALEQFRTFQNGITTLAAELEDQMRDGGSLGQPLEALSERLREIGPSIEEGVADIKQALRDIVNQAFEASGVEQINQIYAELRSTLESYSPANLEGAINELIAPLSDAIDNLLDPSAVFSEVETSFNNLKSLIDPGLDNFLTQLQTQVQPILDAIISKVASLDPGILLAPLDAKYAEIIAIKDRLQTKIQELLNSLDAPYETVVQMIEDMNPAQVLAEPLDTTYQQIQDKIDGVDISAVFEPLFEALKALLDQLIEGINRTGSAFESFLRAAPSGSAGAGVSI